eukprot:6211302-Pleurochrysis_carterae.AAC.1
MMTIQTARTSERAASASRGGLLDAGLLECEARQFCVGASSRLPDCVRLVVAPELYGAKRALLEDMGRGSQAQERETDTDADAD